MDTWQQFALTLFRTRDADPGYLALAALPRAQQCRFAIAWCAYYNVGIAARASELRKDGAFWDYLDSVYDTAARATERRHFRGNAGRKALASWRNDYDGPDDLVGRILAREPTYASIRAVVRPIGQMGDYFVWKWCDLYEVITKVKVDCTGPFAARHSPPTPQEGALAIAPDQSVEDTYRMVAEYLQGKGVKAPPHYGRLACINEAETVCCVYKQFIGGRYAYGLRTAKAVRRLRATPSATSTLLIDELTSVHWSAAELDAIYDKAHS